MNKTFIDINTSVEGQSLEEKIRQMTADKTPIENTITPIYQDKNEGINPAYDIRTDRWEIAQESLDNAYKAAVAQRDDIPNTDNVEPNNNE